MKWTKNWGTVSSGAELYMLNRAERHRKWIARENARNARGPVRNERKDKSEV